ncbi:MAG: hypothetical protein HZC44_05645 [Geobacter sp.]|nr:hypothetical protein [Geobacter sp.]
MKRLAGLAPLLSLMLPGFAFAADLNVDGTTLLRIEERSAPGFSKQTVAPATQFLGIDATDVGAKGLSFHLYGWGRADLADKSAGDEKTDANLTYGYVKYRKGFPNAALIGKAGRFFVFEGIINEQVDGAQAQLILPQGFTLSAFGGVPVKLDRSSNTKGDLIGGGRLGFRYGGIIDVGLSGLHERNAYLDTMARADRQLVGGDIWIAPHRMVDITGRSSYNATTEDFAESSSNDNMKSYGGSLTYSAFKPIEIFVEYKHFKRDVTGSADKFGGEIRASLLDGALNPGFGYRRVSSSSTGSIPSYNEIRAFASYAKGAYSASVDFITDLYDKQFYGTDSDYAYELSGSLGYRISPVVHLSGDLSYGANPDYKDQVKGLVRLTFSYSTVKGAPQ